MRSRRWSRFGSALTSIKRVLAWSCVVGPSGERVNRFGARVRSGSRDVGVYAPFGTDDLFSLVVRDNRIQITPEIYAAKAARWTDRWPSLVVLPWEQGVGIEGLRRVPVSAG